MQTVLGPPDELSKTWLLPYAARMGSSVRSKGLFMEVRERLPKGLQKSLTVNSGELTLRMPGGDSKAFSEASMIISKALDGIERRPVIPREIEDILGISTTERRRWLADGRLPSAGTRTIKLRGRGTITFHVFDPDMVRKVLDQDVIHFWREQDAETKAERRRVAAWGAKSKTSSGQPRSPSAVHDDPERFKLRGWADFEKDGPL